jgi:hypothetical protein
MIDAFEIRLARVSGDGFVMRKLRLPEFRLRERW